MNLAEPELALQRAREFRNLLEIDWASWSVDRYRQSDPKLRRLLPLLESISERIDPGNVQELREGDEEDEYQHHEWRWLAARNQVDRLIGLLEYRGDHEEILGPTGPVLAANRLHSWVWNAAIGLWDDTHYGSAVFEAAKIVGSSRIRAE